jgi:hypothetical protein
MKKKISFDFDGTLDDEFDGSINPQKEEIQKLALKYVRDGHSVCIITKRFDEPNRRNGKGNEYKEVYELANRLGITEIHFTNREMKFSSIIRLKVDMHFENSEYEVQLINQACEKKKHKCVVVPVEDPYWRDLVY